MLLRRNRAEGQRDGAEVNDRSVSAFHGRTKRQNFYRRKEKPLFVGAGLDQFDLVTFGSVDECDGPVFPVRMRPVGERITLFRRLARERLDVVDLEGEMGQIRAHDHGTALVEFADLDFFVAPGRFEENQLRTATRRMPPRFLESQNVPVKRDRFFQVRDAIPRVEKLFDHEDC